MSILTPFRALLVRPEWADHVVSPMHDALSREERVAILAERPYSWLHVARTPDDAPDGHEVDPEVLDEANVAALQRLLDADLYEGFPEPSLFVYRLRLGDHVQTGIVGEVPPVAFTDGRVLGHEGVQPERVDALGLHLTRLGARSTLVALMFRADDDVRKLVEAVTESPPVRRFGSSDLEQTVWRVDDPDRVARLRERRWTSGSGPAAPTAWACPPSCSPTTSSGCWRSIDGSSVRCRSPRRTSSPSSART
jgi:uncharacterized protein (DUF1015 family)